MYFNNVTHWDCNVFSSWVEKVIDRSSVMKWSDVTVLLMTHHYPRSLSSPHLSRISVSYRYLLSRLYFLLLIEYQIKYNANLSCHVSYHHVGPVEDRNAPGTQRKNYLLKKYMSIIASSCCVLRLLGRTRRWSFFQVKETKLALNN